MSHSDPGNAGIPARPMLVPEHEDTGRHAWRQRAGMSAECHVATDILGFELEREPGVARG